MTKITISIFVVLAVMYIIPIFVYGIASAIWGLKTPEGASPATFLLSVLITKIGTAIAFVLIFYLTRDIFSNQWLLYAGIWWIMFMLGEIGQTIGPNYSWKEAIAGIISETMYLPLSAYILRLLLK